MKARMDSAHFANLKFGIFTCRECGKNLTGNKKTWCDEACRSAARKRSTNKSPSKKRKLNPYDSRKASRKAHCRTGKVAYSTYEAAKCFQRCEHPNGHTYKCGFCGSYHVTKQQKRRKTMTRPDNKCTKEEATA